MHEAFTRYIGQGAPAYERKDRLSPVDAIAAIRQAGGLAVLAHPVHLCMPDRDELARFVARLRQMGLDGIETRHSDHSPADVLAFEKLAAHFNLLATGGSDYHGSRKPIAMGSQNVPRAVYEKLRDAHARR
jgi:3',5'-nucleoside bisphosphate phosphatase